VHQRGELESADGRGAAETDSAVRFFRGETFSDVFRDRRQIMEGVLEDRIFGLETLDHPASTLDRIVELPERVRDLTVRLDDSTDEPAKLVVGFDQRQLRRCNGVVLVEEAETRRENELGDPLVQVAEATRREDHLSMSVEIR
jgi:hypothetical protein